MTKLGAELLLCPFCGGEARRTDFPHNIIDGNAGGSLIECMRCHACSPVHFDRKENLYSSWNERVIPAQSTLNRDAARRLDRECLETLNVTEDGDPDANLIMVLKLGFAAMGWAQPSIAADDMIDAIVSTSAVSPQDSASPNAISDALQKLYNEVEGVWHAYEPELREMMGHTNYAVMRHHLENADAALAGNSQEAKAISYDELAAFIRNENLDKDIPSAILAKYDVRAKTEPMPPDWKQDQAETSRIPRKPTP